MLKIYNTLTKKEEEFVPLENNKVKLFVCGPTTYDVSHIGHARTYIVYDSFVEFLRFLGYEVFYLQNITNIDDKIIKRAKQENKDPLELSAFYEKEYLEDLETLKITTISKFARATDFIPQIIDQVKRLLEKGVAYFLEDGIYYDISKFKEYGKLSGRTVEQAEDAVSRIDQTKGKRNKGDFCLWKFAKKGEPFWKSPWGKGRPGWHIEDTAITEHFFGSQYDLHGGGQDLIFPHHEAEIAQMEVLSQKPLAKYWMHTGMLKVKGKKMAKSLKNYITIKDFVKKYDPYILRMVVLKTHWHSPLDYKEQKALEAKENLKEIKVFLQKLNFVKDIKTSKEREDLEKLSTLEAKIYLALKENFNTPKALAYLFEIINYFNPKIEKGETSKILALKIAEVFQKLNQIFKILDFKELEAKIPDEILKLVNQREVLRREKRFKEADDIRNKILEKGYIIEDTKLGPRIIKKE